MKKINPITLSLKKAREDISKINSKLVKNMSTSAVFENEVNKLTRDNLELFRKKQLIKQAVALKQVRTNHSKIEVKRLLEL